MSGDLLPGEGDVGAVLCGAATWCVLAADCLDMLPTLPADASIIADPPYGMKANTDSTRFSGGDRLSIARRGQGRADWGAIAGDHAPFDPSPWLDFPRVVLFGANHYAARLPVGTTLVWIKRLDAAFGTFLSDAEIAWCKGGHGVYCYRDLSLTADTLNRAHPTQKPIGLMQWAMTRAKVPPRGLVVDPYAGSGSTGVAAIQTGRRVILCEIDPTHAQTARRRCADAWTLRESQPALPTLEGPRERARQASFDLVGGEA